ncbi:GtrA family protein [Mesorhizobium sp. M6A.T.Ce.TU.016.01.1.1]|uniref:GtrA family protein n=1 Tax=Mesorhizobium sp. M6A.T.Ce.TU.016.01.1.1 TaxID=2496783 RepID=UPI000FCACE60|nr:GtrA family protein [Mesorhizobium sp. M6A.T.Ce.TU.016.01.1.1]RUU29181.1 GtrA family protein [Mesorhizobium sp. M6A.T.Ce.TU.016.01.1.1]
MSATGSYRRLSRFALIGIASTLIYAACAFLLSRGQATAGLPAALTSFAAYAIAALFSYTGHKYFTFISGGSHAMELPRFLLLTASGLAVAVALPGLLTQMLGVPASVPILLTCIAVPVINYVVLGRWVFRGL